MLEVFSNLPLVFNIGIFLISAATIWRIGSKLTFLADLISEKFQISRSTIGLLFLAIATSLPEVATTLTAAMESYPSLVLNNLFGGIALQTAILAVADGFTKGAISNYPRKADHALEAVLLISLLSIVLIAALLQEPVAILQVGVGSLIVMLAYSSAIWLLRVSAGTRNWVPVDLTELKDNPPPVSPSSMKQFGLRQMLSRAIAYCSIILVVGMALVFCSAAIADQSGLGESFVGVTLLAAATSLPELSTTIAAVRMGAYTLAISNIFGSNLIMLALIFPADLLFRSGPILSFTDVNVLLAIGSGMLVTTVYVAGLLIRRKPRVGNFGVDSIVVILIYCLSVISFYLSK